MHALIPNCEPSNRAAGAEENERLKRIVAKQALEIEPRWRTTQKRTAKKKRPRGVRYSTSEKLALMKQFEVRVNRTLLCQWLDLPRSVSYYQPQSGRRGARPSQVTMKLDGSWVDNQLVVNSIRQLVDVEFNALGYEYITYDRTDFYDSNNNGGIKIFLFFPPLYTGKHAMNQLVTDVIDD